MNKMAKEKRNFGELRFVDFNKYNEKVKQIQRKRKGKWKTIAWVNCDKETVTIFDTNNLNVDEMEEIIIYIKLNREIWRRFTYPSANVLGLSVKKGMSVADTRGLPVESFHKKKYDAPKQESEVKA